jgi:hypothetical protein
MTVWPFDQPENCGTIISRAILDGRSMIQFVSHDDDDHGWQFLDNETSKPEQAALVCLSHVLEIDPTVLELADLPPGWIATRAKKGESWVREEYELVREKYEEI